MIFSLLRADTQGKKKKCVCFVINWVFHLLNNYEISQVWYVEFTGYKIWTTRQVLIKGDKKG
jgi:hypothetical protein